MKIRSRYTNAESLLPSFPPFLPPSCRTHLFHPLPIHPSLHPFLERGPPEQAGGEGGIEGANDGRQARQKPEVGNVPREGGRKGGRERGTISVYKIELSFLPSLPPSLPPYPSTFFPALLSLPVVEDAWAAAARRARCWVWSGWEGGREGGRRFSCFVAMRGKMK